MTAKSDATAHLIRLLNVLRTQFPQYRVQRLHFGQGGEFGSTELDTYCGKQGIILQTTNGYSPQENDIAERANGVVLPRIRAMRMATAMPPLLWGEALLHVVDTLNKLPLGLTSPHERLYGVAPDLGVLRTWGCLAWVYTPAESRRRKEKLQPRARLSLLLGFSDTTKGYKFLDLLTGQVTTAQRGNAHFHEDFTADGTYVKQLLENAYFDCMHDLSSTVPVTRITTTMESCADEAGELVKGSMSLLSPDATQVGMDPVPAKNMNPVGVVDADAVGEPHGTSAAMCSAPKSSGIIVERSSKSASSPDMTKTVAASPAKGNTRKHGRRKHDKTDEKVTSGYEIQPPPVAPCIKRPRRTQKQNVRLSDYVVDHVLAAHGDIAIPITYKQARVTKYWPQWKDAMLSELQSLRGYRTWKLVPRTTTKKLKAITCRWVFSVKRGERGRVTRFKDHLVIHGFKQQRGRDWAVLQYDVKTAFLYGLLKSLYGLKQAPHICNKTLHVKLVELGFERLDSDFGRYAMKEDGEIKMLLTVYVDDLLLMGPPELCEATAATLKKSFELTSMGNVKYLLGVEIRIDRQRRQIIYSQQQYVLDLVKEYHKSTCDGCATPEATSPFKAQPPETNEYLPYSWIRCTKRVLRYLQATKNYGLVQDISEGTSAALMTYSDADYVNDPEDRRSISGYVTMLDGNNKFHMVRRNIELKRMTVKHCGTEDMVADIMTKVLGAVKFARFRRMMKVLPVVIAEYDTTATSTANAAQELHHAAER
ncbi:mitochondrial protein [Phytophthora palmivora]|uniref:Mitochondrial protein n=1 Tax=Phytophthora palmivora TaxID=4796 RepID=A0A2P4XFU2_9STRA|nr:mitochondrial protein [Phytophthora palmivora]